jgi:hypothetical protein
MELLAFLFYQICLQALLPAHGRIYSPRGDAILRAPFLAILLAPFFLRKARQQVVLEMHDIDRLERLVESPSVKLFDDDEQLGQDGSADRQDAVSGFRHATKSQRMLAKIMLEKLAEVLFQFGYAMRDVSHRNSFDLGRAGCGFHRMNDALVSKRYPEEEIRERDRMVTPLACLFATRGARRALCGSRLLRLRGLGLLPHPVAILEVESERTANESLKSKGLGRIRTSNRGNLDCASRRLQYSVNGQRGFRDRTVVALLFLEVSIMVSCAIVIDVYTREILAFRISDSQAPKEVASLLQEIAAKGSLSERQLELDSVRLDARIALNSE